MNTPNRPAWAFLSQPQKGYRFSMDALVLAGFAASFKPQSWADLGTGCGVVAVGMSRMLPHTSGIAIELQDHLYQHALINCDGLPICLVRGDLRNFPWRAGSQDLIVCNPPYYNVNAGQINQNQSKALARHGFNGDLIDFADVTRTALKPNGLICFVFPSDLLPPLLKGLAKLNLFPRHRLDFQASPSARAQLACVAVGAGPCSDPVEESLVIQSAQGETHPAWQHFLTGNALLI